MLKVDYNFRLDIAIILHEFERANNMPRINCIAVGWSSYANDFIKKPSAEGQILRLIQSGNSLLQGTQHSFNRQVASKM
jgi:hypothetical protein